jgi:hypothetical protein
MKEDVSAIIQQAEALQQEKQAERMAYGINFIQKATFATFVAVPTCLFVFHPEFHFDRWSIGVAAACTTGACMSVAYVGGKVSALIYDYRHRSKPEKDRRQSGFVLAGSGFGQAIENDLSQGKGNDGNCVDGHKPNVDSKIIPNTTSTLTAKEILDKKDATHETVALMGQKTDAGIFPAQHPSSGGVIMGIAAALGFATGRIARKRENRKLKVENK